MYPVQLLQVLTPSYPLVRLFRLLYVMENIKIYISVIKIMFSQMIYNRLQNSARNSTQTSDNFQSVLMIGRVHICINIISGLKYL